MSARATRRRNLYTEVVPGAERSRRQSPQVGPYELETIDDPFQESLAVCFLSFFLFPSFLPSLFWLSVFFLYFFLPSFLPRSKILPSAFLFSFIFPSLLVARAFSFFSPGGRMSEGRRRLTRTWAWLVGNRTWRALARCRGGGCQPSAEGRAGESPVQKPSSMTGTPTTHISLSLSHGREPPTCAAKKPRAHTESCVCGEVGWLVH